MQVPKTIDELNRLIKDGVEENIHLEYKGAGALIKTPNAKSKIAKEVSAMANAAGGIIIYGIKEFDEDGKKHLPEEISSINRIDFSKEQLEQIINNNISPKINGLLIHMIVLQIPSEVVYVVEVPQSNTAHQNTTDKKYYKRHNFLSEAMLDYEIRDIMNRSKHPEIDIIFKIEKEDKTVIKYKDNNKSYDSIAAKLMNQESTEIIEIVYNLSVILKNQGRIIANHVNYIISLPEDIINNVENSQSPKKNLEIDEENLVQDIIGYDSSNMLGGGIPKYGQYRLVPLLPKREKIFKRLTLSKSLNLNHRKLTWKVFADNAEPRTGSIALQDIQIINVTENE